MAHATVQSLQSALRKVRAGSGQGRLWRACGCGAAAVRACTRKHSGQPCPSLHALSRPHPTPRIPAPLEPSVVQEQDEVQRLREQLELMTAERDRLLAELQQGGDAPCFVLDRASMDIQYRQRQAAEAERAAAAAAALQRAPPPGRTAAEALSGPPVAAPPRPRSGLRATFRLR